MGRIPLTNEVQIEDKQPVSKLKSPSTSEVSDTVELPYTETENFLGEYFKIGTEWKDTDVEFESEVGAINEYIQDQIVSGKIADSQNAVKDLLKGMEKMNNLQKETRAVVKLEVLANYSEFLSKNEHLKSNLRRYHG